MKFKTTKLIRKNLLVLVVLLFGAGGYAAESVSAGEEEQVKFVADEYLPEGIDYVSDDVYDPWEPLNRRVYAFNYRFDKYVFLPVVRTYETILPDPAERGISNFFSNLGEVKTFANSLLQFKGGNAFASLKRFSVNTTVGVVGLFDMATKMEIYEKKEDFGQTLGHWGVGPGRYLVLPFLGPSNLRDTGGLAVDGIGTSLLYGGIIGTMGLEDSEETVVKMGVAGVHSIEARQGQSFRYYKTGSPFEYELIRILSQSARSIVVEN